MSEFTASALLEVSVDQSSLRAARQEVDEALGTAEVSASSQIANGSSSSGANASAILEDNLDLNQERNDLLRELVDAQEMTARNAGGGGSMLGNLGGGALAIGGGAVGVAALLASQIANTNWSQVIGDAIPDIEPGDVVDQAEVTADDLIDDAADISQSDVVKDTVQAADVVGSTLPVDVSQVVASTPLVTAAALVAEKLPVDVSNLVAEDLPAEAANVVGETLPVSASDVVKKDLPVGVETLLASVPLLTAGSILAKGEFPISPSDIINPDGSGDPSSDPSPTGDGGGDGLPIAELVGGGATGAGLFKILANQGKIPGVSGTSGVSGLFPAEMFQGGPTDEWIQSQFGDDIPGSILTEEGRQERTQIASELATMLFGGDTGPEANGGTRRPDSSVSTGGVDVNESFIGMARNRTGGNAPGPQVEVITVGGESNRNDTDREQKVRVNGNVSVDVTADRSVEEQLRRQGIPDWVVDAVERKLGRRLG